MPSRQCLGPAMRKALAARGQTRRLPRYRSERRFGLIVEALAKLRLRSCIIDGEAVACGEDGLSSFDRIRHRHYDESVFMWAFDLIELDGDDLRLDPLDLRKAGLTRLLARAARRVCG
jgi:bifunctional non-homologous end joining protein LigD